MPVDSLEYLLARGAPRSPDRESLEAWGRALGSALTFPSAILLSGELGAGKTTLVRAIAEGAGVIDLDSVRSPTFSLVQEYEANRGRGDFRVIHVDLYRLKGTADLDSLGWDELVHHADLLMIEWPDKALGRLPKNAIRIELSHDSAHKDRRLLKVQAPGSGTS